MHLRACDECRAELNALRDVRVDLGSWAPPLPDLGFRIVRDAKHLAGQDAQPTPKPSWRSWLTPAAGLAAAATLVLAAALSLAHIEIHSGSDGFTVRTGWSASAPGAVAGSFGGTRAVPARDVYLPNDEAGLDLGGIVRRIDALETAMRQAPAERSALSVGYRTADEELVKRVREMLAQSESREQGVLALRLAQAVRDVENQRRIDLANIQTGFARLDANMTKEATARVDLVNYVTNGSGKQK